MNLTEAHTKAIKNGHQIGHVFSKNICFCKKCNAPLTFFAHDHGENFTENFISGLYGSKCKN